MNIDSLSLRQIDFDILSMQLKQSQLLLDEQSKYEQPAKAARGVIANDSMFIKEDKLVIVVNDEKNE